MPSRALFIASCLALALTGCPKREAVGASALSVLGPGVVNNPKNKSLRFDLLKFGLDRFCREMTQKGTPIRLTDEQPVLGRFFAQGCQSQIVDDERRQSLVVQYNGQGFAWTNLTRRLGFTSAGMLEYSPDFQMHGDTMYIYFRPRNISATSFQTLLVESTGAQSGIAATGIDANELGRSIVESQLRRGFTVIRYDEGGETDFALGLVPVGQKPFRPFQIQSEKLTLANDRTEVHAGQQDYIGAFEIQDGDQALYINLALEGVPAVDVLVVAEPVGRQMVDQYLRQVPPPSPLGPTLLLEPLSTGSIWKRYVRAPKGRYYVVVDHSHSAGPTMPQPGSSSDRGARVDYAIQVGDAP